jgi:hypothetical protein
MSRLFTRIITAMISDTMLSPKRRNDFIFRGAKNFV